MKLASGLVLCLDLLRCADSGSVYLAPFTPLALHCVVLPSRALDCIAVHCIVESYHVTAAPGRISCVALGSSSGILSRPLISCLVTWRLTSKRVLWMYLIGSLVQVFRFGLTYALICSATGAGGTRRRRFKCKTRLRLDLKKKKNSTLER